MSVMTTLTTNDPIKLVQITDTHLYAVPAGTLLKMNTRESLDQVVQMVREKEDHIDLVLATGDIAQDASAQAYEQFMAAMEPIDAPLRWIPGNHDSPQIMNEVATGTDASEKLVQINNWLLVFLDTSIDGQVHGRLAPEELEFLDNALQQAEADDSIAHSMTCLHHNPIKGNAGWMKDIGLHNGEEFFQVIAKFDKTNCVVYGHVHQELDYEHEGIRCLCTPSTCIQFKPNVNNFALDRLNPGYRSLTLHADGSMESEVHRVADFAFDADFSSQGY